MGCLLVIRLLRRYQVEPGLRTGRGNSNASLHREVKSVSSLARLKTYKMGKISVEITKKPKKSLKINKKGDRVILRDGLHDVGVNSCQSTKS